MSNNFNIAAFVSSLKNGSLANKKVVFVNFSKIVYEVALLLKSEGFIDDLEVFEERKGVKKMRVFLKYFQAHASIMDIKTVSTPGKRQYLGYKNLIPNVDGLGIRILSTNRGIVTDRQAKEQKIGGEILINVF